MNVRRPEAAGVPETVGPYRILKKLGEGGMGVVYAARDGRLERDVALKMIRAGSGDPHARERLWREARAAARVSHPNVCQLFEVGEEAGQVFIAMELLEGEPLSARIERGPVAAGEALQAALGVLAALETLHKNGIVHRDLKPSNVFVTAHGVKLLDFGLARWSEHDETTADMRLTQTGVVVGTPRYMAPEQWASGPVGPAADLFALGAILFEMLTGRPAFGGSSPIEIYHAVAREQPPALVGGPAVVVIDRVLQRALSKRPSDRPATAAGMAEELRRAAESIDTPESVRIRTATRLIVLPLRVLRPDPETDFLAYSLPDAITESLSGLASLVVRSSAVAARFGGEHPDLKQVAAEADVDVALLGTLLRAADQVRVSVQLVEAPSGTLVWSKTAQVLLRDLFPLQDELARQIVESLSIPLSSRERRLLQHDVPASALAFELYLRANQVGHDRSQFPVALGLYRKCLDEDPGYAPAWARVGRIHRVMAKYALGDVEENRRLAEEAFQKALEINPDLPVAHNLYTYFEVEDLGRAPDAIARLLEQARARPSDPELFAGLVMACRYGGLLDASVAADARARHLDPAIRTSVAFTFFMRGDYAQALERDQDEPSFFRVYSLPMMGRTPEAIAYCREIEATPFGLVGGEIMALSRLALENKREESLTTARLLADSSFRDPEGVYFMGRILAWIGEPEHALATLERVVEGGFHCALVLRNDPWLDGVRGLPRFQSLLHQAEAGRERAQAAFVAGGGEALLGNASRPARSSPAHRDPSPARWTHPRSAAATACAARPTRGARGSRSAASSPPAPQPRP